MASSLILLLVILPAMNMTAMAALDTPYDGYQYNEKNEAVAAPVGYVPQKTVSGKQLPVRTLGNASDLFVDDEGLLNIVNTDTGCLIVLDNELNFQKTLYFSEKGSKVELPGLCGLFIKGNGDNRRYYAADPENKRVIIADSKLNIIGTIQKPDSALFPGNISFSPSKVLVDQRDNIYVLVPGLYRGACVFSADGRFITFFGSNKVELSARMLIDYFWKRILSKTQRESMARYIPVEYSNFDITQDNFIYTVTQKTVAGGSVTSTNEIKKMNAKSVNVYKDANYGDLEVAWSDGRLLDTAFVDIDVMDNGFVAALDATQGRVFMYDDNGQWLTVFGGIGVLKGLFRIPVAIETIGNRVYVLDQMGDCVTMFTPSVFGEKIITAMSKYNSGDYEQSVALWEDVIQYSGGYSPAYISIGKTYLNNRQYDKAMMYFKLGNEPKLYSDAFREKRNLVLRKWAYPIFILLGLFIAWIVVSDARDRTSRKREIDPIKLGIGRRVRYTLFHPTEGYEACLKDNKRSLVKVSVICVILWFFSSSLKWQYSGYVFSQHAPEDFNIWVIFGQTYLVLGLFVLSNWFVSTMMDGNGRLIDIVFVSSTGMIPFMVYQIIYLLLSNALTAEEGSFLSLLAVVCCLWSAVLVFLGLKVIHEFTFGRNLAAIIYTLLGIFIILFLALLIWSLFQQLIMFVVTIANELSLKMK